MRLEAASLYVSGDAIPPAVLTRPASRFSCSGPPPRASAPLATPTASSAGAVPGVRSMAQPWSVPGAAMGRGGRAARRALTAGPLAGSVRLRRRARPDLRQRRRARGPQPDEVVPGSGRRAERDPAAGRGGGSMGVAAGSLRRRRAGTGAVA
jgi:hypothetical protein